MVIGYDAADAAGSEGADEAGAAEGAAMDGPALLDAGVGPPADEQPTATSSRSRIGNAGRANRTAGGVSRDTMRLQEKGQRRGGR
jgi:hypothetical protein